VDTDSSPLLALFYADASFSGQSMSHHPSTVRNFIAIMSIICIMPII
jgi:hypothetical protein